MKLLLVILPMLLVTSACSSLKPGCIIEDKLAAVASDVVATKLQCANRLAVHQDVAGLVKSIGLCKTGPIADAICPIMVKEVVEKVAGAAIPASWQCSAEDAKSTLTDALTNACKLIPVNQWEPPAKD